MNTGFRLVLTGRLASSRTVAGRYQVRANHGGFRPKHGPPNRNISDDFGEEAQLRNEPEPPEPVEEVVVCSNDIVGVLIPNDQTRIYSSTPTSMSH